jgi:tuftelin-interacting protein 11
MLAFLDAWEPLLPPAALSHVLFSLVLPRLAAAVERWDPRQETVPIHVWLHPWLPHLGAQLEAFYPTIRHRLTSALTQWHPADGSARALLAPWRRAFEGADWDALLARSIVPKLALALQVGL